MDIKNKQARILIVDDVSRNIQILGHILQAANYRVNYALGGQQAIELAKENDFALILLDIMMPEMDGYETCSHLKALDKYKDVPVIFLTAKDDIASIKKGFEVGGVDYIVKPFNREELMARVQTHVTLWLQKREQIAFNRTKDKLFSIIGHDLGSPMSAIQNLAELMLENYDKYDDKTIKKYLKHIFEQSSTTSNLLINLLEGAALQAGRIKVLKGDFDCSDVVEKCFVINKQNALNKNISLVSNVKVGNKIYADENLLTTAIRNLISNAIKFTPEGGKVSINIDNNTDFVKIEIQDTGVGIDENNLKNLFDNINFFTTRGTGGEKGTGLGLAICREFVEIQGGTINVESQTGVGSKFTIQLPILPT